MVPNERSEMVINICLNYLLYCNCNQNVEIMYTLV